MGLQFAAARAISAVSTWGLKHVFRRPAANFPGKVALYVDPHLIAHARTKLICGSVAVVGTNGKTTVTNLLADVLERGGARVVCNRTGANLDSGVATSLLHARQADWGIFECDELWLAKILPNLRATYVVLLNLFRDQLDRCGEIDRIQDSIVRALASSPDTVLVYNADDPLCAMIAERAAEQPGRERTRSIAFGVAESMGLAQNTVTDAAMCQRCSTMFEYDWRQYGQLGEYRCPTCGFARPALDFAAQDVQLGAAGLSFSLAKPAHGAAGQAGAFSVKAPFSGAYMVYNLAAVGVAASLLGATNDALQRAIDAFDPQNGRLQTFDLGGRRVLLNLAKNPTGFNQNLKIVTQDPGRKAVAFFINDKEADGRDVSWLWDIDFEELAGQDGLVAFAGGLRGADMCVRLKYADIPADVVESPEALLARLATLPPDTNAYLIANYTALPSAKAALETAAAGEGEDEASSAGSNDSSAGDAEFPSVILSEAPAGREAEGSPRPSTTSRANDDTPSVILSERSESKDPRVPSMTPRVSANDPAPSEPSSADADAPSPLVIAHLFPDLLNLYGDGGNVRVLEQRLRWRGIPVEVRRVHHGESVDLTSVDLVMMGGSPDREQRLASADLVAMRDDLRDYVEAGGPLLAICGSYQMLGREWLLDGEQVEGLGIVDMTTRRPGTSGDRLIDNIALRTPLADCPVVGYENHAGRTYLGQGVESFGQVVSSTGCGNNEETKQDGVRYRNLIGTYLHGPLLVKNPEVADWLLARALDRHATRTGTAAAPLTPLDDTAEQTANQAMCEKLNAK